MNNVKAPTGNSFHEHLIDSLQDPEEAALYVEAILEEPDPEPTLLKSALLDVVEAFNQAHALPESHHSHLQKLDEVLAQSGSDAIYGLADWLNNLGLKLSVTVADQDSEEI